MRAIFPKNPIDFVIKKKTHKRHEISQNCKIDNNNVKNPELSPQPITTMTKIHSPLRSIHLLRAGGRNLSWWGHLAREIYQCMVHLIRWLSIKNLSVFVFLTFWGWEDGVGHMAPLVFAPTLLHTSLMHWHGWSFKKKYEMVPFNVNLAAKKIVYEPLLWSHLGVLQSKGWVDLEGPTMD